MVEKTGLEPATPCLQGRCSPNWATTPYCNLFMYWWSCQPPWHKTLTSDFDHLIEGGYLFLVVSSTNAQLSYGHEQFFCPQPQRWASWWGIRDSNPYTSRYWSLNPARLPIPPIPQAECPTSFIILSTLGRYLRVYPLIFGYRRNGVLKPPSEKILTTTNALRLAAPVGLEPTTSRLTVWRSTDWATGQYLISFFILHIYYNIFFVKNQERFFD